MAKNTSKLPVSLALDVRKVGEALGTAGLKDSRTVKLDTSLRPRLLMLQQKDLIQMSDRCRGRRFVWAEVRLQIWARCRVQLKKLTRDDIYERQ